MEDDQNKTPVPARSRKNAYKILTITLFSFVLLVLAGFGTVEATSSSPFCGSCHEMKPEAETWKASSHSQVACKECHIQSGVVNYAKAKMNGLAQVYQKVTNSYTAPITMPTQIPNSTCEKCHNMKDTLVNASGDLIIPHDKHLAKDIKCVECHYGVVHGDISDRGVTYKSDYVKWDTFLGKQMMSNVKFTRPKMEDCISCHQARDVSTACKTCHSTGMKPASHNAPDFKTKVHGLSAQKDILKCNNCHQYTSENPIKNLQKQTATEFFLSHSSASANTISAQDYAKENTFCPKCHSTRPPSRISDFANTHGALAKADKQKCLTCHVEKETVNVTNISSTIPACSSCHPATHEGKDFKSNHPIPLTGVTKPSSLCYTCHNKSVCTSCHKEDGGTLGKLNNQS